VIRELRLDKTYERSTGNLLGSRQSVEGRLHASSIPLKAQYLVHGRIIEHLSVPRGDLSERLGSVAMDDHCARDARPTA